MKTVVYAGLGSRGYQRNYSKLVDCNLLGELTELEESTIEIHQNRQKETGDPDGFLHREIINIVEQANFRRKEDATKKNKVWSNCST